MGNPLKAETTFEADGKTFRVVFDWNAAAEYEELSGKALSDALLDAGRLRMSAKSLRAFLWAGLQTHHPALTLKDVGELIAKIGRKDSVRIMGVALRYYFPELGDPTDAKPPDPGGESGSAGAGPPKGSPAPSGT
jgi:hypothetical protein